MFKIHEYIIKTQGYNNMSIKKAIGVILFSVITVNMLLWLKDRYFSVAEDVSESE